MQIKKIETDKDINSIINLFLEVMTNAPYNEKWNQETAKGELVEIFNNGKGFCFIATEDEKNIGFIFSRIQPWEDGNHLIIEYIVVDPSLRKNGVGTALFRETEKIARNKDIKNFHLISHRQSMAKDFWEKQGFKMQGIIEMSKTI
ncbi:MAG: N-acetyltransferase GCN5 [Candidatus Moranbacteria bacterium GW2011_GWE2_35_2-]|nr:MAG: N-acetyltransferase GCN5 [Candidatus Moranbacteria bacterium GW2011_GWE2_35_2-]KKQ04286.1 MAG: N-acetyltransferase GCN5 [Candidatus Moranbacteria bacterium GW2011_GWF1_36_4]KKQ22602.1 MAG: N-acetyltransferase GCN5 [Candidatus Moranbacteria bacterium GW2011_GWF2_37_11]KKQ29005.1 MAG: N-acetyltransferase GCN5 [Candidatus Moranbacteria bacterium GW2011_GWD1_37_17]KKQ30459.1 MAG: N-acetyltransferase GCN5 [Candidatus Moranbacteria bacterium GW2011_GWE1_37_24]KKQ47784.1 MAG: N-acetyltransfer